MIVMRKLLWLLLLVVVVGPLQEIDAQNKLKQKTVVSKNGDKYVGTVYKERDRLTGKKKFVKTGEGKMYYADGSVFEGEWRHNFPSKGTYRTGSGDVLKGVFRAGNPFRGRCEYTSGDVFEGTVTGRGRLIPVNGLYKYKNGDVFEGKFWEGIPEEGTKTFAAAGDILIGGNRWSYPASCRFIGQIRSWSGLFDCPLKNTKGDTFEGKIQNRNFIQGKISYANGNIFEGDFAKNAPKNGVFFYACETNVQGWTIPLGSKFTGDVVALTGAFDQPIVNIEGDRYTGGLKCGKPDGQGSMTYARTGKTESGIWHEGLSPSAYRAHLEQQRKEKEQQALAALEAAMSDKDYIAMVNFDTNPDLDDPIIKQTPQVMKGLLIKLRRLFLEGNLYTTSLFGLNATPEFLCEEIEINADSIIFKGRERKWKMGLEREWADSRRLVEVFGISKKLPTSLDLEFPNDLLNEDAGVPYVDLRYVGKLFRESDVKKGDERVRQYFIREYGEYWGRKVLAEEITLGMTIEMVEAIRGKGEKSFYVSENGKITLLTKSSYTYVFVNGILTEYYKL